jgi:hypothetical protein
MYYTQAMESQIQYRNLHHVSYWEIAIARIALWELGEEEDTEPNKDRKEAETREGAEAKKAVLGGGSLAAWRELEREATVSWTFSDTFFFRSLFWFPSIFSGFIALCLVSDSPW